MEIFKKKKKNEGKSFDQMIWILILIRVYRSYKYSFGQNVLYLAETNLWNASHRTVEVKEEQYDLVEAISISPRLTIDHFVQSLTIL